MMGRLSLVILAAALTLPTAATAQMGGELPGWHETQVKDFETMRDKFMALAEAFPAETWDWRPMEGVRSVKDVMALMVAEGNLFPSIWGASAPAGVGAGFGPEMERVGAMSRTQIISEMEKAFEHLIESCRNMTSADHMAEADWFGTKMTASAAIASAAGDMHEHLGQSIAYARMNKIVPPWSR